MTQNLRTILDELYAIDPSLRSMEEELLPILQAVVASRRDVEPSEDFVSELRTMLRERARSLATPAPRSHEYLPLLPPFLTMVNVPSFAAGAVLALVVAVPLALFGPRFTGTPQELASRETAPYSIEDVGSRAFGDLAPLAGPTSPDRVEGGGAGGIAPMAAESAKVSADAMIVPSATFAYVYTGEPLDLTEGTVSVLQRETGLPSARTPDALLDAGGLIDLSSFSDLTLDSYSLIPERGQGYFLSVSPRLGTVFVNEYWSLSQYPGSECGDDPSCWERLRIRREEIQDDAHYIAIAEDFLEDHGIDRAHTGTPEVDHSWEETVAMLDTPDVYIPETVSITFPYRIEDQEVYEPYGPKAGISVSVSVRSNKVVSVGGIVQHRYDRSAYPAVTDWSVVEEYLRTYGQFPGSPFPEGMDQGAKRIELAAPVRALGRYVSPTGERELLVPSLVFSVTKTEPAPSYGPLPQQRIVVPLAREILEAQAGGFGGPSLMMERTSAQ
jgi:hypothetical protein